MMSRKFCRIHGNIIIFKFSVIFVIQKNYGNPKYIQNLVLYFFESHYIANLELLRTKKFVRITLHIMGGIPRWNLIRRDWMQYSGGTEYKQIRISWLAVL